MILESSVHSVSFIAFPFLVSVLCHSMQRFLCFCIFVFVHVYSVAFMCLSVYLRFC